MRGWCSSNVDGIVFMDDWGANSSLLIHPKTWRELFKPLYQEYVDLIHAAASSPSSTPTATSTPSTPTWSRSASTRSTRSCSPWISRNWPACYKGKITFWGEIDRQHILPFGTPDEVRAAVRRVRAALDDGRGGVIAQCEWGKDNPIENVRAVYQAWME